MQLEADAAEPDVIIPWPLVIAAACGAAFIVLSVLLAGKGETPFDRFWIGSQDGNYGLFANISSVRARVLLTLSTLNTLGVMVPICVVMLYSAFSNNGRDLVLKTIVSPVFHRPRNVSRLVAAEVLIGVVGVVVICRYSLPYLVLRHGPFMGNASLPTIRIAAAVAFWSTLARVAFVREWLAAWKLALLLLSAICPIVAASAALYFRIAWPSDVVASCLLGCAFASIGWYALSYAATTDDGTVA